MSFENRVSLRIAFSESNACRTCSHVNVQFAEGLQPVKMKYYTYVKNDKRLQLQGRMTACSPCNCVLGTNKPRHRLSLSLVAYFTA